MAAPRKLMLFTHISRFCEVHRPSTSRLLFRKCSSSSVTDRDPAPLFFKKEVQLLLKNLMGFDVKQVFRARKLGRKLMPPTYTFMTEEELNEAMQHSVKKASEKLQMPPVLKERQAITEILSFDPALQGYSDSKSIFTDITYGISNRERVIVVREPDGTLRKATWEERDRMNQIYFPVEGKLLRTPKLFEDEFLKDALDRKEYLFILDYACFQFEPDDPIYIKTTQMVYDFIDDARDYDALYSTRHFGTMIFHLSFNKKIDHFLLHLIQKERLDDAVNLIKLHHIIHPDSKSAKLEPGSDDKLAFIKLYVENDSQTRSILELAVSSYEELQQKIQENIKEVKKAHGHST